MIKELVIFAVGAGVGAAATYLMLDSKYKKIIEVELEEIRESYDKRMKKLDEKAEEIVETKAAVKESTNKSEDVLKDLAKKYNPGEGAINYSDYYKNVKGEITEEKIVEPEIEATFEEEDIRTTRYEIPPYAFFDNDNYSKRSYILTSDHVLIDEVDSAVGDADNKIGNDILLEFINDPGETELYVRNDDMETDYEIIKDDRSFLDFNPLDKEDVD